MQESGAAFGLVHFQGVLQDQYFGLMHDGRYPLAQTSACWPQAPVAVQAFGGGGSGHGAILGSGLRRLQSAQVKPQLTKNSSGLNYFPMNIFLLRGVPAGQHFAALNKPFGGCGRGVGLLNLTLQRLMGKPVLES
jgi:hypothetical protein